MSVLAVAATLASIFISLTAVNASSAGKAWLGAAVLYFAWWMG